MFRIIQRIFDLKLTLSQAVPAMHSYGPVLSKLLLRFVYLPNEINESFARFRDSLFGPIRELELTYCPGRSVPCIGYLELSKDVLRHIVLGNWVNDKALVPN